MALWGKGPQEPGAADQLATGGAPVDAPTSGTLQSAFDALKAANPNADGGELAVKLTDLVLAFAVKDRASDIHFEPSGGMLRVRYRIDGIMIEKLRTEVSPDFPITQRLRVLAGFDPEPPKQFRPEEGRIQKTVNGRPIQVRVSSFPTIGGEKIVLRILDQNQLKVDIERIGFTPNELAVIKRIIENPHGIFFVTGATGSGKTTTLYAMLKSINKPEINIMTLEDPVEYRLEGVNQAQINSKSGFTFSEGLRTILRQDPNVILVGEIRDFDTAEISMRASLTGHLVFATLHTISAVGVVERLLEMGVPPFLLSSSMLGALAQRLVRKLCQKCAQPAPGPDEATAHKMLSGLDPVESKLLQGILAKQGAKWLKPGGCAECNNTGFTGRVPIFELMLLDARLRQGILQKEPADKLRQIAMQNGMRTLLIDGIYKAWAGWTTVEEVLRVTGTMN